MSDTTLRRSLVRLAYTKPELRACLLPVLTAEPSLTERLMRVAHEEPSLRGWRVIYAGEAVPLEDREFMNPKTHNKVKFKSLPPEVQSKIRDSLSKGKKEKGLKGDTKKVLLEKSWQTGHSVNKEIDQALRDIKVHAGKWWVDFAGERRDDEGNLKDSPKRLVEELKDRGNAKSPQQVKVHLTKVVKEIDKMVSAIESDDQGEAASAARSVKHLNRTKGKLNEALKKYEDAFAAAEKGEQKREPPKKPEEKKPEEKKPPKKPEEKKPEEKKPPKKTEEKKVHHPELVDAIRKVLPTSVLTKGIIDYMKSPEEMKARIKEHRDRNQQYVDKGHSEKARYQKDVERLDKALKVLEGHSSGKTAGLRRSLVRLAYTKPELRKHLLPLIGRE